MCRALDPLARLSRNFEPPAIRFSSPDIMKSDYSGSVGVIQLEEKTNPDKTFHFKMRRELMDQELI